MKVAVNHVEIEASNKVDADNVVESIIPLSGKAVAVKADSVPRFGQPEEVAELVVF